MAKGATRHEGEAMDQTVAKINPARHLALHPGAGAGGMIPDEVWSVLARFMLDRKTGNVKLNIKDGRILGYHVEEICKVG